ncbi:MAG: hypothetical protein PF569_04810 [Candidatus Woesearchaeota archaeon]|jgi:predicted RNase H-like nuclease (RuvC/YqgF family)|nr:hypothetical protein [Candidatus Woesearchaeota archaeon]
MNYKINKKALFGLKINYTKTPGRKVEPYSKKIDALTNQLKEINNTIKKDKLNEAEIKECERRKIIIEKERELEKNRLKKLKRANLEDS